MDKNSVPIVSDTCLASLRNPCQSLSGWRTNFCAVSGVIKSFHIPQTRECIKARQNCQTLSHACRTRADTRPNHDIPVPLVEEYIPLTLLMADDAVEARIYFLGC